MSSSVADLYEDDSYRDLALVTFGRHRHFSPCPVSSRAGRAWSGGLTESLVARQVYANVLTMDRYLPGVIQVGWDTEPHFAYAAIHAELTA